MIRNTTVSNMDEYANDQLAVKERPGTDPATGDDYYAQGVKPGFSAPAKWWNWLFNALTKRVGEERSDLTVLITELKNVLAAGGIAEQDIDPTDNTQLLTAVNAILGRIATSSVPGLVKSSDAAGKVQVQGNGIMQVNGIGDFDQLSPDLSSANTLIEAIDLLYEQLQALSVGVPAQPPYYDAQNPVLDTTTLEGNDAHFGGVNLAAGWYYIDISGGGGGGRMTYIQPDTSQVATITSAYAGGFGSRSRGWIFVMSPGLYLYGVGAGGKNSFRYADEDNPSTTYVAGDGGACGLSWSHAIQPCYMDGADGVASASALAGGTGGATILFSCPTQEAYCVSGGSGGTWGVQNNVTLVSAQTNVQEHQSFPGALPSSSTSYYGALAEGESVPASGQLPWVVQGWDSFRDDAMGAEGGFYNASYHGLHPLMSTPGRDGWVKIYRGTNVAPST